MAILTEKRASASGHRAIPGYEETSLENLTFRHANWENYTLRS